MLQKRIWESMKMLPIKKRKDLGEEEEKEKRKELQELKSGEVRRNLKRKQPKTRKNILKQR